MKAKSKKKISKQVINKNQSKSLQFNNFKYCLNWWKHFFKKLIFDYNDKLKIEVVNHFSNNLSDCWCIWYKMPGYTREWDRLNKCYILGDSYELLQSDFPVLLSYNQAVEKAKSLTVESINHHNKIESEKYKSEVIRLEKLGEVAKSKVWKNY